MGRLPLHRKRNNGSTKKKGSCRKTGNQQQAQNKEEATIGGGSWVDRLGWVPVEDHDGDDEQEEESSIPHPGSSNDDSDDHTRATTSPTISIISWNILAEAYCSRRSHPELPKIFQKRVFDPLQRRERLVRVLTRLILRHDNNNDPPDVLCLQEWDLPQVLGPVLQQHGYTNVAETPRVVGGGSGGRTDACVVYVRTAEKFSSSLHHHHLDKEDTAATTTTKNNNDTKCGGCWEVVEHEIVRFDDLATLASTSTPKVKLRANGESGSSSSRGADNDETNTTPTTTAAADLQLNTVELDAFCGNNLQGIQRSFLRRNMGLLVRLRHVPTQRTVIVANAHLYWNPGFEYVKVSVVLELVHGVDVFCC